MCFSHSPEFLVDLNLLTALLTCASPDARMAAIYACLSPITSNLWISVCVGNVNRCCKFHFLTVKATPDLESIASLRPQDVAHVDATVILIWKQKNHLFQHYYYFIYLFIFTYSHIMKGLVPSDSVIVVIGVMLDFFHHYNLTWWSSRTTYTLFFSSRFCLFSPHLEGKSKPLFCCLFVFAVMYTRWAVHVFTPLAALYKSETRFISLCGAKTMALSLPAEHYFTPPPR